MYEITVERSFDSAHCLRDYQGNCSRLHGHTYRVIARFRFASLDASGMTVDFRKVKQSLKAITDYLDHQYINDLPEFSVHNPTAENMAKFIYDRMKPDYTQLFSVGVWETPTSCATYYEEG